MSSKPLSEWQLYALKLFNESQGFCVLTHKPCIGHWEIHTALICAHHPKLECRKALSPDFNGDCYEYNSYNGKKIRCECASKQLIYWRCGYGDYACYEPFGAHYELYIAQIIKEHANSKRSLKALEWENEQKIMHSLGERRTPLRGRFSNISRDIRQSTQPLYYLEGIGIDLLTFKPFAKVRLVSSWIHLFIPLGDTLRGMSANRKHKVIRYGKPIPNQINEQIHDLISQGVREYLK